MTDIRPWDLEPDYESWTNQDGFHCAIIRNSVLGHLCGYVGVRRGHPLYGLHYHEVESMDIGVHGGITFSGPTLYYPMSSIVSEPGTWYFGFDCAHHTDFVPGLSRIVRLSEIYGDPLMYKDFEFVRDEISALSTQLHRIDLETTTWESLVLKFNHWKFVIRDWFSQFHSTW